jgi:hypothetical protein
VLLPLLLALFGCSKAPTELSLDITTGHETDAMTSAPAVVRVDVTATADDGSLVGKASAAPGGAIDLGSVSKETNVGVKLAGVAADGSTVLRGATALDVSLATAGSIPVFAARVDTWSRPPSELTRSHINGQAAVIGGAYLLLTGGDDALDAKGKTSPAYTEAYDLVGLFGAGSTATMPRTAKSLVARATTVLLIDDAGASEVELSTETILEVTAPAGLAFGDVAGGSVIDAADGTTFVVGATREGKPSDAVLVISADGSFSARKLVTPRAQAAAAWIDKVGLVIVGGSSAGAGVEVLASASDAFHTVPYPSDPIVGATLTVGTDGKVLVVGGADDKGAAAPARSLDLACSVGCKAAPVAKLSLKEGLVGARLFAIDGSRQLLIGHETNLAAHVRAFAVDLATQAIAERPLREARRGATALASVNGAVAVLGGAHDDGSPALTVELFQP